MWGPILTALRTIRRPPPPALIVNLDDIRVSFRNPTQHPDKVYDIDEAQDVFIRCIGAVNQMVNTPRWRGTANDSV